uniref:Uncharacterized protein n=1 Tax=Arundo donax TaxID=35708 RepID=A0A0A9HVB7_ARUDO
MPRREGMPQLSGAIYATVQLVTLGQAIIT